MAIAEPIEVTLAVTSVLERVHVGGSHRGLDYPNSHALGYRVERRPELVIAIAQQDLRRFSVHRCISQLLGCPLLSRVPACNMTRLGPSFARSRWFSAVVAVEGLAGQYGVLISNTRLPG